jgi:hypothetical protein
VPLPDILPLEGSLAHGLVFSHYDGFLSHVLPGKLFSVTKDCTFVFVSLKYGLFYIIDDAYLKKIILMHMNGYTYLIRRNNILYIVVLKQTIEQTSIYRAHPQRVSRKYHILLPKTCDVNGSFESYDDQNKIRIKKQDIIEFKKSHVDKPRVFKLSIYEITKECETGDEVSLFLYNFSFLKLLKHSKNIYML